jgi:hypothetical protein
MQQLKLNLQDEDHIVLWVRSRDRRLLCSFLTAFIYGYKRPQRWHEEKTFALDQFIIIEESPSGRVTLIRKDRVTTLL